MVVRLGMVTRETVTAVCRLEAGDGGRQVAPNALSIAQAHFCDEAWFRAVYDDEELVGFVMVYDPTLASQPAEPDFVLWRLMIDKAHQGRGLGRATVDLVIEHVRARPGARRLLVSHVKEAAHLGRFYQSLGFRYTGTQEDNELVMERLLD